MKVTRTGPWKSIGQFHKSAPANLHLVQRSILKSEAQLAADQAKKAIETEGRSVGQSWESLSDWTVLDKGSSSMLKETGLLKDSIQVVKTGLTTWSAQIDPSKSYGNGKSVAAVAGIMEHGAIVYVQLTARMARYLAIRARELGIPPKQTGPTPVGTQMLLRIPPRPFWGPVGDEFFGFKQVALRALKVEKGVQHLGKLFRAASRRGK